MQKPTKNYTMICIHLHFDCDFGTCLEKTLLILLRIAGDGSSASLGIGLNTTGIVLNTEKQFHQQIRDITNDKKDT